MMLRYFLFLFLAVSFHACLYAQPVADTGDNGSRSRLRISILTGSPGSDDFETFGHTCIRVIDSNKNNRERDLIYNYGFFEVYDGKDVLSQFLTGRARVLLDTITYEELIREYTDKKRGLTEQELLLDDKQKVQIVTFLNNNMNDRYYFYDGSFDNCTTRTRDMLSSSLGSGLRYGQTIPEGAHLTFRKASTNTYCPQQHKYWYGLLLNIFYATRTDKVMTNSEAMFLASYFSIGLDGATIDGKKLVGKKTVIFEDRVPVPPHPNQPMIIFMVISVITIVSLTIARLRLVGKIMSTTLLFATGVLGCVILYMWVADHEPGWKYNLNILWALPTNLIIPFLGQKIKRVYGLFGMAFIAASLLVTVGGIQVMPLLEIGSLWLALLYIYFLMYKKSPRI